MYNSQKNYELTRNTALLQFGYRLLRGMNAFGRRASRLVIMLASWYSIFALWLIAYGRIDSDNPFIAVVKLAMYVLLALLLAAVPIVLFWCWGGPFDAGTVQRNLIRAGLTNSAGEGPTLIDVIPDSNNPKIKIYKFWVIGIPLSIWQDKIEALQTALNATVAKIIAGKDGRYILVYAAPPVTSLPRTIYWPGDSFKSTALVLGESITGPVTVDLSISPHILIGGSTGSGKTYLVLSLIYQALLKGFATYILDMKGGIDFPMSWKYGLCHYVATRTDILSVLSDLVHELEKRQATVSFKCKKRVNRPRDEWWKVENTHEAIISKADFDRVQQQIASRRRQRKDGTTQIFAGLVKCTDCGWTMGYCENKQNKVPYGYYHCIKNGQGLSQCTMHYIRYDVLYAYVLSRVQYWSAQAQKDGDALLQRLLNSGDKERAAAKRKQTAELWKAEKRKTEVDRLFAKLYEDWSSGRITDYNFNMLSAKYQDEQTALDTKIQQLQETIEVATQTAVDAEKWLTLMKRFVSPTELTAELLNTLIEKILVHEAVKGEDGTREQEIEIYYRFIGKID